MARAHNRAARARGFTLIEIMVVVAILAILGATVVPMILDRPDQARVVKAKQDIRAIEAALDLYKLDNFNYPTTEQGLEALVAPSGLDPVPRNFKDGGYLERTPMDPWGRPYLVTVISSWYSHATRYKRVFVLSAGPDGRIDTQNISTATTDIADTDIGLILHQRS